MVPSEPRDWCRPELRKVIIISRGWRPSQDRWTPALPPPSLSAPLRALGLAPPPSTSHVERPCVLLSPSSGLEPIVELIVQREKLERMAFG